MIGHGARPRLTHFKQKILSLIGREAYVTYFHNMGDKS
jgi:hypothetical protein